MDRLNLHLSFLKYAKLDFLYSFSFFNNFDRTICYDKVIFIHTINLLIVVLLNYDLRIRNLMGRQINEMVNLIISVNQLNMDEPKLQLL